MTVKTFFISAILVVFLCGIAYGADTQETQGLIMKEMAALDKAFKITVDAVILNQPDKIVPAFAEVQSIREQVEQAVKDKKKITLPKNQNKFKAFLRLDHRFHREVEAMVRAAKKKRMRAVNRQTHNLLTMCVRCHDIFRKQG